MIDCRIDKKLVGDVAHSQSIEWPFMSFPSDTEDSVRLRGRPRRPLLSPQKEHLVEGKTVRQYLVECAKQLLILLPSVWYAR